MNETQDFKKIFKAPEGNYRDIVLNYMLAMADKEWTAGEDFEIIWKNKGDFKVELKFEKGQVYHGVPYSQARATLGQFLMFLKKDGCFTSPTYYYEEMVGNHCSSSIGLAYQQLVDFPFEGRLKPGKAREGLLSFANGLQKPENDEYFTSDVFELNGKEKVFEAYASLGAGDIVNKIKQGTGHARMVHRVETCRKENGEIDPEKSTVYCIEQTNEFDKTRTDRKTTWWIDRPYTFQKLWNTYFMPLTLDIFHTKAPIEDAYISFDFENTAETVQNGPKGKVTSNFPLAYVRAEIKDENGNTVREIYKYKFNKQYSVNLQNCGEEFTKSPLPSGNYSYTLKAGIARGDCLIENFEFTV